MDGGLELFATFDRSGRELGLCPRHEVHRQGLWHRSAQVFVFDSKGRLLIQRRAPDKDLYAGLWDYSVGEHLKPGEDYQAGALRGLSEELGINEINELQPLGGQRWVEIQSAAHVDREIQQAYRCEYDGVLQADPVEVAEVRYIAMAELMKWMNAAPDDFTPWFVTDLQEFSFLD